MSAYYLSYPLHNGYLHNWLVAGPHATPVHDLDRFQGEDFKYQIVRHYHQADSGVAEPPVEWQTFTQDDTELRWRHVRCLDDHFVDLTAFYHTCHYLQAWAYTELLSPAEKEVTLVLTTNGPADVWVNGEHVHRQEHFHHQIPHSVSTPVTLQAEQNTFLIRFEAVATRECPYVMALQLAGFRSDEAEPVRLPIAVDAVERYQHLERLLAHGYFDRDVFNHDDGMILRWPQDIKVDSNYTLRIQRPDGRIYAELQATSDRDQDRKLLVAYELQDDTYEALFMPDPREYYEKNIRVQRKVCLRTVRKKYSSTPYGTYAERRQEALKDAAMRWGHNVFTEIAKMAGGWWKDVDTDLILKTIEEINQRGDCSDFYLTGLLGMLYRFGEHASFPEIIKQPLEDCILGFRYWADEPGDDAMWFWSENHQILFHTCEILAGQRYPDRVFSNSGQTGQWHREKGERLARAWLEKRARYGFQEWDSNCYFEHDLLALSHLLDLAESEEIWELAAVVMDKIFLTMALNSYKGVFGSTHGRSYTPFIKGGYLETTSGISRLMWGLGTFNQHILGTVSMACNENYQLPEVIAAIATDQTETMWSRERHAGEHEEAVDRRGGHWEVNKVTYRTPDYMLCSAQDYHAGKSGYQQHIWQATMGSDAVVFANHPACLNEDNAHRPGAWHGNVILPRVAQWQDVLVAIHKLPEDDWLGFTHAYFPSYAFDEHTIRDGWAFARKGDGYLALTAAQGFELITQGQNAYRELRSHGGHNVWLCQMGRTATDGSFKDFQEAVLKAELTFEDMAVNYKTLRGDTLAFGWEGPFLLNDEAQPLSGFRHYEGPFCAAEWPAEVLAIGYGHQLLRLNLSG